MLFIAAGRVSVIEPQDYELIAQEVSNLRPRIAELEASVAALSERVADVQRGALAQPRTTR